MLKSAFTFYIFILAAMTPIFCGCENSINKYYDSVYTSEIYMQSGYNLYAPDTVFYLPSYLNEISGLSLIDDSHLIAIQDERGIFYLINLQNGNVDRKVLFGRNADYEGIELVGNSVFVSISNGNIYKFKYDPDKERVESEVIKTPLKSKNDVEGLAYDKVNNRLLIACKGKGDIEDNEAKGKCIYAIDLDTMEFNAEPAYCIKKKDISEIIKDKYPDMKLSGDVNPSGIAIHPISGQLFVLAHGGKAIIVLNKNGEIEDYFPLNPSLFQQPEGICFNSTGDMYISNEVGKNRPNVLIFRYQNED